MDKLIKELQKQPLSGAQMMDIVEGKARLMTVNQLKDYKTIDQALGRYGAIIFLYEMSPGLGHWVCLFKKDKNTLVFFDPYGLAPDEQLPMLKGYSKPYLSNLLLKSKYTTEYNDVDLQRYCKNIATCGKFVSFRLIFRHMPNDEFISLFLDNKHYDPDFWITALMTFL